METVIEQLIDFEDEKMSSLNHSELESHLAFLLKLAYRDQYSIFTELDLDFASGKTRPDLCIFPKRRIDWLADEIVVQDVPLTTIEILSPEQSLNSLTDRIYIKTLSGRCKVSVVSCANRTNRFYSFARPSAG